MLNQTQQTLLQVDQLDSAARAKLDSVVSDARKLERTVEELQEQVEFMKNSDIRGEGRARCPLGAGFRRGLSLTETGSLLQGRPTASQSTSCSRRTLKLAQTPPPWTPAAPWKCPATCGDSQATKSTRRERSS